MSVGRMAQVSVTAGLIGALAVSVGGLGVAVAANGGSLTLGQANSARATTTLADSNGTPLALKAGKGKAPFVVNSSKQVAHLNASQVGGSTASSLRTSGSAVASHYTMKKGADVTPSGSLVAETAKLAAGTYFATADAYLLVPEDGALCDLSASSLVGKAFGQEAAGAYGSGTFQTITQTRPLQVKAGQRIGYYCEVLGASAESTELFQTALTAIRVDHSSTGQVAPSHDFALRRTRH